MIQSRVYNGATIIVLWRICNDKGLEKMIILNMEQIFGETAQIIMVSELEISGRMCIIIRQ